MQQTNKTFSLTQIKLFLNLVVLALFITVNIPQLTGLAGHEWVSFVFVAPFLVHLVLNWKWITSVFARLFKKLPGETRFNQIWDTLLFTMMTLVIFSGTVVSEAALPALGIRLEIDPFWRSIHTLFANLMMLMFGVHLSLHWKWIANNFRRYVLQQS